MRGGLPPRRLRAGAGIHAGSPVVAAEDTGAAWRLRTPRAACAAAACWWRPTPIPSGPWPALGAELVRLPYFNLATAPLGDNLRRSILPGGQGAWDTRAVLSSFRMDRQGRLIFGSVGALRGPGRAIHWAWGRRALARLFPQLGAVAFESECPAPSG